MGERAEDVDLAEVGAGDHGVATALEAEEVDPGAFGGEREVERDAVHPVAVGVACGRRETAVEGGEREELVDGAAHVGVVEGEVETEGAAVGGFFELGVALDFAAGETAAEMAEVEVAGAVVGGEGEALEGQPVNGEWGGGVKFDMDLLLEAVWAGGTVEVADGVNLRRGVETVRGDEGHGLGSVESGGLGKVEGGVDVEVDGAPGPGCRIVGAGEGA